MVGAINIRLFAIEPFFIMVRKKYTRKKTTKKTIGFTAKIKNAIVPFVTGSYVVKRVKQRKKEHDTEQKPHPMQLTKKFNHRYTKNIK